MWGRAYALGTSCLREVGMDISTTPKSVELLIDFNDMTVPLPTDFLNYTAISLVGNDGLLYGLGLNNEINLTQYYNECGVPTSRPLPTTTVGHLQGFIGNPTYLANHYRNGENFGAYFNAGGHNDIGGYKIDYNTNRIKLVGLRIEGNAARSVVLEYIADIVSQDNDFQVHPFLVETIKNWIYWKWIQRDRNFGLGEKQLAENSYNKARKWALHRYSSMTMQEALDSVRKNNSAIPKF
jgi:hypothetical protein